MNVQEKREMKRWLWPLLLFMSMFFVGGCDSDEDFKTFDGYETLKLSEWNDDWNQYFEDPWVHWETYKNQEGIIVRSNDGAILEIRLKKESVKGFNPINLSQNQLEEGMIIIFSGEARDNYRIDFYDYKMPLILKNVQVKKNVLID